MRPRGLPGLVVAGALLLVSSACGGSVARHYGAGAASVAAGANAGSTSGEQQAGATAGEAGGAATVSGANTGAGGATTGAGVSGPSSGTAGRRQTPTLRLSTANEPGITDTTIQFCSVLPLTGPLGFIGKPQVSAMDSYFRMVNDAGGINGRKILWKSYDDGFDPVRGVEGTKKCVEQDHAWALGPGWNAFTVSAAIKYLEQVKVPWFFSDGATTDQYKTGVVFPYGVLCDTLSQDITDRVIVDYGARRLGIVWINNDIGQLCLQASQQVAKANGASIAETDSIDQNSADATPIILRMRAANVDAIIVHGSPTETIKVLQAAERQSYKPAKGFACSGGCALDVTLQFAGRFSGTAGPNGQGVVSNSPLHQPDDVPEGARLKATIAKYHPEEHDFGQFTLAGWAYARMLTDALREAGRDVSRQKLADTLRSHTWENGFSNPANFNPPRPGTLYLPLRADCRGSSTCETGRWAEIGPIRDIGKKYPGIAVP